MLRQTTIRELILAGVLCAFSIGSTYAADPAAAESKNEHKDPVAQADADYKAAKDACESKQGNDRDLCLKQAEANHVKTTAQANAQLKSNTAMADTREATVAQYKIAKAKCDALPGDDKEACIKDAKIKYHQ